MHVELRNRYVLLCGTELRHGMLGKPVQAFAALCVLSYGAEVHNKWI